MKIERRNAGSVTRNEAEGGKIEGYAALFNSNTEIAGLFVERIAPGAFDDVMGDDVRALIDHNPSLIIGRTAAGTLNISVDERGLKYSVTPPDTTIARDLVENIRAGNVSQSSFGFTVAGDEWEEEENALPVRTITRIGRLYDVSPVTFPAYQDTEAGLRAEARSVFEARPNKGKTLEYYKRLARMKHAQFERMAG